jgi:type II secretory pathway pseudopilin PulG
MIVEMVVAMGIMALVLMSSITGLLSANRQAAAHRALTAARMIVERNIESALAVTYDASTTPAILATTSAAGAVYDDDGGGDNLVNILVQNTAGTNILLKGTLTRIVTMEANSQNAPIRRITFRLAFNYRGRNYTTEMTTLRAIDDF